MTVRMKLELRPSLFDPNERFLFLLRAKDFNRRLYLFHFLSQLQHADDYLLVGYKCGRV